MPPVIYRGKGYDDVHANRYQQSLEEIKQRVPSGSLLLELGGGGAFTEMLREHGYHVVPSTGDLRYIAQSGTYDAVLCMEVIEHIHDIEDDTPTEWRGTGAAFMMKTAFERLALGGLLFVTTPNADSINVINKVIHRQGPMVYRPHVREYTVRELREIVASAGFAKIDVRTWDPWHNAIDPVWEQAITKLLTDGLGATGSADRGEDIFLWASKLSP